MRGYWEFGAQNRSKIAERQSYHAMADLRDQMLGCEREMIWNWRENWKDQDGRSR
jgi:hypothetical protein